MKVNTSEHSKWSVPNASVADRCGERSLLFAAEPPEIGRTLHADRAVSHRDTVALNMKNFIGRFISGLLFSRS